MAITNQLITNSLTSVYNSVGENAITTIIICNTSDSVTAKLTLHIVPNGSIAGTSTQIVRNLIIPPAETVFFSDEKVVLGDGDIVYAVSDITDILAITVSVLSV